jgi:hypothetical protein
VNAFDHFGGMFLELAKAAAVSALEPVKDRFRVPPGQSGAITRTLRGTAHDETSEFARPKARDAFLLAAWRYLKPLHHEELLVAVGTRRGQGRSAGARLVKVHRVAGSVDRVALTPKLRFLLDEYLDREGGEVVLVHNHPRNPLKSFINELVGWRPIPSAQDRDLALSFLQDRLEHCLMAHRPSSWKWYLVDEGQIAEFVLPTLDVIAALMRKVQGR